MQYKDFDESTVLKDEDFLNFDEETDMVSFLETTQENTEWREVPVENVSIEGIDSMDDLDGGISDADEDTINNGTKLFLNVDGERFPIRACGISSIEDRAGVAGEFLKRLDPKELASVVTLGMSKANILTRAATGKRSEDAKGKICLVNGKVSAFLSANGGNNEYAVQPSLDILRMAEEAVAKLSDPMDFRGSFSYSEVYAKWLLTKTLDGVVPRDDTGLPYHVAITMATSDIGVGSVRLSASLIRERSIQEIPLVGEEKIIHRNGITAGDVQEAVDKVSAGIEKNAKKLAALDGVLVENPVSTMKRVAKACKLPKKSVMEVINKYEAVNGNKPMSALECFTIISRCTEGYKLVQKNPAMQALLQRNLLKASAMNWHAYDIPGEFNW